MMPPDRSMVMRALGLAAAWTLATYVLEGRIELLQRPDPIGRLVYALVANLALGTLAAGWFLRGAIRHGLVTASQAGFRSPLRTALATALGAGAAAAIFLAQGPRSLEPLVVFNVFAQVLPTSVAEIMICWAVVGLTAHRLAAPKGRVPALSVGIVVAAVTFGVYHFAHSAPFNQLPMVLFLTLVGLVTGLVYFMSRDVYATVLLHNALGMTGVINSAPLEALRQPLYPVYVVMALAILVLLGVHVAAATPGGERSRT